MQSLHWGSLEITQTVPLIFVSHLNMFRDHFPLHGWMSTWFINLLASKYASTIYLNNRIHSIFREFSSSIFNHNCMILYWHIRFPFLLYFADFLERKSADLYGTLVEYIYLSNCIVLSFGKICRLLWFFSFFVFSLNLSFVIPKCVSRLKKEIRFF